MASLTGKIAWVTGGGSGMGLASVKRLLEEGASVAISGRDAKKLEEAAKGLKNVSTHPCDVAKPEDVKKTVADIRKRWGRIDILVNNAGINMKERTFRELTPESWDRVIRINLDGAFYCIHAVLPEMLERKDGVIININSISGIRAYPLGGVAYAASKFGMTGLGMGLAAEEKDNGIRVTNIYPGEVDTPILEHRPSPVSDEHRARILRADDVARAVAFVACQPPHVSIPELVIKPISQMYV